MENSVGWAVLKNIEKTERIHRLLDYNISKQLNNIPIEIRGFDIINPQIIELNQLAERLSQTILGLDQSINIKRMQSALTMNESVRSMSTAFNNINNHYINNLSDMTKRLHTQFDFLEQIKISIPTIKVPVMPKNLVENIDYLSKVTVSSPSEYDDYMDDEETALEYEQLEIELIQELESNPKNIWQKINEWSARFIDIPSKFKQKRPAIYLLIWFTYSLISSTLFSLQLDITINKTLHEQSVVINNPKQDLNIIKSTLEKEYGIEDSLINQVRVTIREIPVYQSNKVSSNVLDKIMKNKPIIILEKRRNWSYVMYSTEENEELTGWVFTRYLQR